MKLATFAASLFVGAALAAKASDNVQQVVDNLTQCGKDCLASALTEVKCTSTDYNCGCEHYTSVTLALSTCVSGKVLSGDCSLDDVNSLAAFSTDACTDITSDDISSISRAMTSLVGSATELVPELTSLASSATSRIGGITATTGSGTQATDASGGDPIDSPGAGPMVTPMAWAGAAVAVAALAL